MLAKVDSARRVNPLFGTRFPHIKGALLNYEKRLLPYNVRRAERSDLNPNDLFIACTTLDEGSNFLKQITGKKELLKSISCFWNQEHVTNVFTGTCHCY